MTALIVQERPDTPDAISLINELEDHLASRYPSESRHGFSVEKLIAQGVAFFVVHTPEQAVACGGIQIVGDEYGELKRIYVRPQFRGRGYGKLIMNRLAEYARERGITCLRLETGSEQTEAIGLYERFGFVRIPPFGDYVEDPLCIFYEKQLS